MAMTPAAKPMPRAADEDSWIGVWVNVADADAVDVKARLEEVVRELAMLAGMISTSVAMVDRSTRCARTAEDVFVLIGLNTSSFRLVVLVGYAWIYKIIML